MNLKNKTRTIRVDALTRVEGEGALRIKYRDNKVLGVQFRIFEPPRFFEALLRGRRMEEAPDMTARICGICPVAYQISAVQALEDLLQLRIPEEIRLLRRLLYCGEWIESHVLHIYMLHAPDFLGYPGAIEMAKDFPEIVRRGLDLKKAGNQIVAVIGGREVHPINVRVGGFYRLPRKNELHQLEESLKRARDLAAETVRWVATFPFPEMQMDYQFAALRHPSQYAISEGKLITSGGKELSPHDYETHFEERQSEYSNALYSVMKDQGAYFLGPLARYNLNFDRLPASVREAAASAGLQPVCKNPFQSILVRSIEVLFACEEALQLLQNYREPESACVSYMLRKGTGHGFSEAPRGVLYHQYSVDDRGYITHAKIVPPTSQNQKTIEADLKATVERNFTMTREELTARCETVIRNYDPCISCATHFLKLEMEEV